MNVRLTPQQEEFVKRQVAEGRYLSEAEVIREGLRLLADEMKWRGDARQKIAIGMEQLRAGQVVEGEQAVKEVLKKLRGALGEGLAQADRGELIDGPPVVAEFRKSLRKRGKSNRKSG